MNIAFLGNHWLPHTKERIKNLKLRKHNIYYFSWPIDGEKNHNDIIYLPYKNSLKWKGLIKYLIPNILRLRKLIYKYKISIIHIMGITNGIYSFFLFPAKIVVEHNGSDILVVPKKLWYYKWYYKLIYKYCNGIIQDSNVSKKAGINYGAPIKNNEIINIGVDFTLFNPDVKKGYIRDKYNFSTDCKIIFQPRGFRKIYNNDLILQSIPLVKIKYPNVKFVFCGYYDHINTFNEEIRRLGIEDNVFFAGRLSRDKELPFYYADADIVISIPSSDSSPLSVFEAMACKTPVILSSLPWLDHKFNKVNYAYISDYNHKKLSQKIIDLLITPSLANVNDLYNVVYRKINAAFEAEKLEYFYKSLRE